MESLDVFNTIISGQDIFYRVVLVIFAVLYSIFSLILYIQINSLIRYVDQISFSPTLRFIAIANIVASALVIGYTILTLIL